MTSLRLAAGFVMLCSGVVTAQDVRLIATVNDSAFFEGEPIYLVVELQNRGTDTVRTLPLGFVTGSLRGSVEAGNGPVPEFVITADRMHAGEDLGIPVAPGESKYASLVLLSRWGYPAELYETLLLQSLPPGRYALTVSWLPPATAAQMPLRASRVEFLVRSRTVEEERVFREVQTLGSGAWDPARRGGFLGAVAEWCRNRLRADSADPFVPYLLKGGVGIAAGLGMQPVGTVREELLRLQTSVASRNRASPVSVLLLDAEPMRSSSSTLEALLRETPPSLLRDAVQARLREHR
jgi:hypothetical protein